MAGGRQGYPAVNGLRRLFRLNAPGIVFTIQQVVIPGQNDAHVRPALAHLLRHLRQITRSHRCQYQPVSQPADGQAGGITFGDDYLRGRLC